MQYVSWGKSWQFAIKLSVHVMGSWVGGIFDQGAFVYYLHVCTNRFEKISSRGERWTLNPQPSTLFLINIKGLEPKCDFMPGWVYAGVFSWGSGWCENHWFLYSFCKFSSSSYGLSSFQLWAKFLPKLYVLQHFSTLSPSSHGLSFVKTICFATLFWHLVNPAMG